MHDPIIGAEALSVRFRRGDGHTMALDRVSVEVSQGEFVGVTGPSGAGKTTLLNALAGLLKPMAGTVSVEGHDLYAMSDARRARLRNRAMGIVFQTYHLHPLLTVQQNVELPLAFGPKREAGEAGRLLEELGLGDLGCALAGGLSAGQKQRVVVARALVTRPQIVLADEPTANLDAASAEVVLGALRRANRDAGATILLVAHDRAVLAGTDRTLQFADGGLLS